MGNTAPCICMDDDSQPDDAKARTDNEKTRLLPDDDSKQENKEDPWINLSKWKQKHPEILKLNDNRLLYYSEYGSKTGFPIIHMHGSSSSRIEGVLFDEAALASNIRLICIDRPGIGLSTMDTEMTYESICNDTFQLIQHLDLKENEYGFSGISQGGSHVLHHIYYLQDKLKPKVAVLMSGLPPFSLIDDNNAQDILSGDVKTLRNLRQNHPKMYDAFTGLNGWMLQHCFCLAESMFAKPFEGCESDTALVMKHKEFHLDGLKYSISGVHGMDGNLVQGKMIFANWDIDLAQIDTSIPIICFHGNDDPVIPLEWVKLLDDKLPQMQLHVCDGHGHLLVLNVDMQNEIIACIAKAIQ